MQDHEGSSCVIETNTGAPSGEHGGKNESAVMATSPKEDHNSQSTVLNRIYKRTELLLFSKIY